MLWVLLCPGATWRVLLRLFGETVGGSAKGSLPLGTSWVSCFRLTAGWAAFMGQALSCIFRHGVKSCLWAPHVQARTRHKPHTLPSPSGVPQPSFPTASQTFLSLPFMVFIPFRSFPAFPSLDWTLLPLGSSLPLASESIVCKFIFCESSVCS